METKKIYLALRILVIIGWVGFFFYNLYIVKFLGSEYNNDPSNFVFFEDEENRQAYRASLNVYADASWIDQASLVNECKPVIYFNDFYFEKIDPFIKLVMVLILLTLIIRIDFDEWKNIIKKFKKVADRLEGDDGNKKID